MSNASPSTLTQRDARAYIFRVLLNGQPQNIGGVEGMQDGLWILPRNPVSVQYQAGTRNHLFPTGLLEMSADQQGVDPPLIQIGVEPGDRGGFDAASGQGLDGRRTMRALENLIRGYVKAAATAGRAQQPIHVLEFHDIYREESWVVVPLGVPYGLEDAGRPMTEATSVRLQALRRADQAISPVDAIEAGLRDRLSACPLNPRCKYGGPAAEHCPYKRSE